MKLSCVRLSFLLLFLGSLFCGSVSAQEFQGTLLGRVTDASRAVLPGASIIVTNQETNTSVSSVTNDEGNYRVPFLLPGNYLVAVEAPGFKKIVQKVHLSAGSQSTLDFTMEVGEISATVTVSSGQAPLLETSNADLGQVIERTYVENLPVSLTRNPMNRIFLAPGVRGDTGTYTSNAQTTFDIMGGGGKSGSNEIMVDGIPNTIPQSGGVAVFIPSQDLVDEMKVHTTLFDAAYGHSNGGVVNFTTRSGTNNFHGTAYGFKRWRALNANSWRNNQLGIERPPTNYHQYGGVVSGPVFLPRFGKGGPGLYNGRNRTFFIFSYESDLDPRDLTKEARVPTALERTGDFSQTLNRLGTGIVQIYDPLTTTGSGAAARRTAFAGARIPAERLSPIGLAVAKAYPLPNLDVPAQINRLNWVGSGITEVEQTQWSMRIDQRISERQRMFGRYSRLTRRQAGLTNEFPAAYSYPSGGTSDLGIENRYFDSVALDDTISFSPAFIGSLRYGFSGRSSPRTVPVGLLNPSGLNLPPVILQNQSFAGWPRFQLGESFPEFGSSLRAERWYTHTGLGTFYKIMGDHSLKFGVDYRLTRKNTNSQSPTGVGDFTFNNTFTRANPSTASTGDTSGSSLASLLLGIPNSGSLGFSSPLSLQNHYWGLFIQNDWKASPNLTLNFGLRYELETPYTERFNRGGFGFDFDAPSPIQVPGMSLLGGLLFAGVDGNSRRQGNLDKNNFGPRIGFAFSFSNKTVVRGGYGVFFSSQTYNSSFEGDVATFNASTSYVGTTNGGATPFTTLADPFPTGIVQAIGNSQGLAARYGDNLSAFNPNRVNPYNQQWQLSIQRQLPWRMMFEAAYAGMLTLKQLESFDLNEKPDRFLSLGAEENRSVPNPFFGPFNSTSSLGRTSTTTQGQLWKQYPQYTTLTIHGLNTGRSTYHSLQTSVEKRFSDGLNFLLGYTYSKSIERNTTSVVNPRNYRSVSDQDFRHVMRLAVVYEMPFGPGKSFAASSNGFVSRLFGGWTISGYINARSGEPLSFSGTNGRPIVLRNPSKSGPVPERLGDQVDPQTRRVVNPYFDIDAFVQLPQYTISPTSPFLDWLRGPGDLNLNMSLIKVITIRESVKFQLRADSTNVTNSPHWGNPGTNLSQPSTFGVITSGGGGRSFQMGARLSF
ncbi:MAG TPA: carboxypeptidase regulatory-like domain-containing protein [Acidobacteriota bacterium]